MTTSKIATREEWVRARLDLLTTNTAKPKQKIAAALERQAMSFEKINQLKEEKQ